MVHLESEHIEQLNRFTELIDALRTGFQKNIETPMRHHHDYANPAESQDSTLLLMPSWEAGENLGVKIVTVSPDNGKYDLPSVHGLYILFDAQTGQPKSMIDGKSMTAKRTAAASALASSYLSNPDAKSLLMVGTGALSVNLIEAHCSQRPIEHVLIWGRSQEKANGVAECVQKRLSDSMRIDVINNLDQSISEADIISCATLSPTPLIKGELLRPGQHIDLVGSYKKDTREANDAVLQCSTIFVDTFQGGLKESGDIVIPLERGVIARKDIVADLYNLSRNEHSGRTSKEEITVFKSVGHASEDLIAANYFFAKHTKQTL